MSETPSPEIGASITTGDITTNYHDLGSGDPLLLIHGSGPGVSSYANWRLQLPVFAENFRVLALDMAGFGYTTAPDDISYTRERWLQQIVDFLDALGIEKVSVVGNSFGGSMALGLAVHHPERVNKLILMGSVGVPFSLTDGLDKVWGYQPSEEAMGDLMRNTFAHDGTRVTDDMIRGRYAASVRPGIAEAFSSMFPAPRQRWVDSMAYTFDELQNIEHETLLVHGREDKVIPLETSLTMMQLIPNSRLHVFGKCGHWTQIEHADAFAALVTEFLRA